MRTGKTRAVLDKFSYGVNSLDFSPDGQFLATATADNAIALWETKSWQLKIPITKNRAPAPMRGVIPINQYWIVNCVRFSPDGRRIATAHLENVGHVLVRLWETATGRELAEFRGSVESRQFTAKSLAFSPDGGFLLVGGTDFTLLLQVNDDKLVPFSQDK